MNSLDILYMCDEGFAEVAGVSITSLFENNPRDRIQLHVYLLAVGISEENKERFRALEIRYGQKIEIINSDAEYQEIQKLKLDAYRGSSMTNLRLHFDKLIPQTVHRILYIDCDTIICDELTPVITMPLNGKLLAMSYDAYGKMLANKLCLNYYNAGILLIDCDKWRQQHWRDKIETFIEDNTEQLAHPDQDVFNIVCKDEIVCLPIRYNFQVVHREYSEKLYFQYLAPTQYYSEKEICEARVNPAILHMIRSMGTNPWYEDGELHPDYPIYKHYKDISAWSETTSVKMHPDMVIVCERLLKKILPASIFFPISLIAMRLAAGQKKQY